MLFLYIYFFNLNDYFKRNQLLYQPLFSISTRKSSFLKKNNPLNDIKYSKLYYLNDEVSFLKNQLNLDKLLK